MMDRKQLIKYRLKGSASAIHEHLSGMDETEVIFDLYLPVKDAETRSLVAQYERYILMSMHDRTKFALHQYEMLMDIVRWIRDNNKYRLFADFAMYVSRNLEGRHKEVGFAYITTLMDTWANLAPRGKMWYGFDENDRPMFTKELYWAYDVPGYEIYEEIKRAKKNGTFEKNSEKFLARINRLDEETQFMRLNERAITNTVYAMVGLINDENEDFIYPGVDWFDHVYVSYNLPRTYAENEYYLSLLRERKYLLSHRGVIVKCYNAGIFGEIRYKEEFLEDGLIVLFRVSHSEEYGHTMGFIDLRDGYIFSPWQYGHDERRYRNAFMNFVLEVYAQLTCDFEKPTNRLAALRILGKESDAESLDRNQPGIYCVSNRGTLTGEGPSRASSAKSLHHVEHFTRKGNASEMAKARARKYGLILPQGTTFVRDHFRGRKDLLSTDLDE